MAVVVGVTMGVMKPLLSKLTKLLEEEYVKFKGVRKQIKFLRDELSAMSATLEDLADADPEKLNTEVRLWRDKLRELAYDLEDCIDAFMARVDHGHDGGTVFEKYFRKLKKLIARHDIANQIQELKASVKEAAERHKRYIVVIDDVWDTEAWEFIKLALPDNDLGSRIISTTRSVTVAKCCSSQIYEMKPLSFDDSKRLFFKRAFGSETSCYPHLEDVPDRILRKCGGLPLAIVTVSSMLTNELAKAEWDRVLRAIGSALAKNPGAEKMTTILSMSYFDIPRHLRTCLLYLSVFPEDFEIEKQPLIHRWIAEGFIHEEGGRTKYEIGEGYFNDLINRSMIQPVDVKYGQAKACRVHDIILDYIKCKAAEENFVTLSNGAEHVYTSSDYKVRRLCVNNHTGENVTIWEDPKFSHVRSVTIFGQPVKTSLLPSTALRVLDLGGCWGIQDHHLASIDTLFHLKYLRLSSGSITKLPEKIGELQYLQTLDVRGTRIEELPSTITKLQRLSHLYAAWDSRFPDGVIGQMHSLEEMRKYGVESYEQGKSLQEFNKLTKLRTLKIELNFDSLNGSEGLRQAQGCHSYLRTLLSSCNLYNLYITESSVDNKYPMSLDSWRPTAPCSLQKLCLKECLICKVPNWMASLGNIVVLKLQWILYLRPEDVEILGAIPSLLFLILVTVSGTNGRISIHGRNGFRCLKYLYLDIFSCGTALEFQVGSMPKLEHVKLALRVHKSECLNGASDLGIQHLSALSKVEVEIRGNCMRARNYNPTEDKKDDAVRWVASAINSAIMTHPNRPTIRFETWRCHDCERFECCLREWNQWTGGLLTEWLKIWQIEEEQEQMDRPNKRMTDDEEQASAKEGEDETDNKEEEDTCEEEREEQTDEEKELEQREGN
ncbi:disease resistance protein Pik-2-like isoform X3 [Panicum virgatum]|uniref:disease resistance protein Pik-2-like isoform X3 n=1 Tax=Panicum virgatum TaxID=38727 RepID=UPI0019D5D688|nr:disease resistance protein Pik-2-like isoform X3 [Panicum virgatum]